MRNEVDIKTLPSARLLERALALAPTSDEETADDKYYWSCIRELHCRGSEEELALALALVEREPTAQAVAADILGQLAFEARQTTGRWAHRDTALPYAIAACDHGYAT